MPLGEDEPPALGKGQAQALVLGQVGRLYDQPEVQMPLVAVFADVGVSVLAILNASRALRISGQDVPEPSVPVALPEGNG